MYPFLEVDPSLYKQLGNLVNLDFLHSKTKFFCIPYKTSIYVRNLVICVFLKETKRMMLLPFFRAIQKIRRLNEFSKTKIRYHNMSEDTQKPVINSHFKYFFQNRFPTAEKKTLPSSPWTLSHPWPIALMNQKDRETTLSLEIA
ncbi:hypothetical protein CDAR_537451 [Caerostris darwini]|uniref:Maturase K n=1 Tax=Caerostris darwini TaxID=1538125 RepID=A0AAV4QDF6_9ARAC|nr:hypothetical protein CDAR_537451 [Caerostris darwini]